MDFFDPKIPKEKVIVEILHTQSTHYLLKCILFLNTSSKYSEIKSETMHEFLHNCGQFIPIQQPTTGKSNDKAKTNSTSLYNKNEIIYIKESKTHVPEEQRDLLNVQVILCNKSSLKLSICKSFMGENNRLAEYTNNPSNFLTFIKYNSHIHINKNHIFSIKAI